MATQNFLVTLDGATIENPLNTPQAATACGLTQGWFSAKITQGSVRAFRHKAWCFVDPRLTDENPPPGEIGGTTGDHLTVQLGDNVIEDPMTRREAQDTLKVTSGRIGQLVTEGRLKAIRHNGWLFIDPASVFCFVPKPVGHPRLVNNLRIVYDQVILDGPLTISSCNFDKIVLNDPISISEALEVVDNSVMFYRCLHQNHLPGFRYKDSVFFPRDLVIDWHSFKAEENQMVTLDTLKVQAGKKILDNPLSPKDVEDATYAAWLQGGRREWTVRLNAYQHKVWRFIDPDELQVLKSSYLQEKEG